MAGGIEAEQPLASTNNAATPAVLQEVEEEEEEVAVEEAEKQKQRQSIKHRLQTWLETQWARSIAAKALEVVCALAYSTINPFLGVFYYGLKYDPRLIGVLLAAVPFVSAVAPLWTLTADKTHKHTLLWMLSFVLGLLTQTACWFFSAPFGLLAALVILMSAARAAVWPFVDACVVGLVGKDAYGKQRLWMSATWGVGAVCASLAISKWGIVAIFVLHAAVSPLFIFVALFVALFVKPQKEVPAQTGSPSGDSVDEGSEHPTTSFVKRVWATLRRKEMLGFLLLTTAMGIVHGMPPMIFVFLEERFAVSSSGNSWLWGALVVSSILLEVPCFYFAEWFTTKLGSFAMFGISLVCCASRVLIYTFIPSAWYAVIPELLHGPMFGLCWAAGVRLASSLVPKDLQATGQGLFYLSYNSVGMGAGVLAVGASFKAYGSVFTFRAGAVVCMGILLTATVVYIAAKLAAKKKPDTMLPSDAATIPSELDEDASEVDNEDPTKLASITEVY